MQDDLLYCLVHGCSPCWRWNVSWTGMAGAPAASEATATTMANATDPLAEQ